MDRRSFIEILPIMPFAIEGALSGQPGEENPTEKNVFLTEEEIEFFGKFEYPNPEDVPELLKGYMKNFSSWPEVYKNQKESLLEFLDSPVCKNVLTEDMKEYFPRKTDTEISVMVEDLIKDKKKKVSNVRLKYKDMSEEWYLGEYKPKKNKVVLDTMLMEKHSYADLSGERYSSDKPAVFIPFHELWHASEVSKLTLRTTYRNIILILNNSRCISDANSEKMLSGIQVLKNGRIKVFPPINEGVDSYALRPHEIIPCMSEMRGAMHVISKYNNNKNIPPFNMNTDVFDEQHYFFMRDNLGEILPKFSLPDEGVNEKILVQELFKRLSMSNFLQLMNKCL